MDEDEVLSADKPGALIQEKTNMHNMVFIGSFSHTIIKKLQEQRMKFVVKNNAGVIQDLSWACILLSLPQDQIYTTQGTLSPEVLSLFEQFIDGGIKEYLKSVVSRNNIYYNVLRSLISKNLPSLIDIIKQNSINDIIDVLRLCIQKDKISGKKTIYLFMNMLFDTNLVLDMPNSFDKSKIMDLLKWYLTDIKLMNKSYAIDNLLLELIYIKIPVENILKCIFNIENSIDDNRCFAKCVQEIDNLKNKYKKNIKIVAKLNSILQQATEKHMCVKSTQPHF